ncbi:MAG: glycosyltransferase family 4 protein [Cytophagaceae bacterium]|nr:glycosyltransferase family 4 protein [Cytophagaceae bacterium]
MRILYVYQFFKTPDEGGIIRSYYLAKALTDAGHDVTVLTSHNGKTLEQKRIDGLTVHYLPVAYEQSYGFMRRIYAYLKFALTGLIYARRLNAQRLYVASVPLTIGLLALGMKWLRKTPYFFEVGDLWPQTPIEMGIIRNRLTKKLLYAFEQKLYREADTIVALSPTIQTYIEQRGGAGKTRCLPNIADCSFFQFEAKKPHLECKYNVEQKKVVTYFGSIGKVVNLETLIQAAHFVQNQDEEIADQVIFLIVGTGSELPRLRQLAAERALTNLRFLGHVDKYTLREILNVTDAVYISFLPLPVLETNSPNKLFDALAAGKPCIMNLRGWHTDLLEQHRCGWYAPPDQPAEFWAKLRPFLLEPSRLNAYGYRARQLAEAQFSRQELSRHFVALFAPAPESVQRVNT